MSSRDQSGGHDADRETTIDSEDNKFGKPSKSSHPAHILSSDVIFKYPFLRSEVSELDKPLMVLGYEWPRAKAKSSADLIRIL